MKNSIIFNFILTRNDTLIIILFYYYLIFVTKYLKLIIFFYIKLGWILIKYKKHINI